MKASELRDMGADDIKNRLEELEEEAFNFRFQHVSGQLASPIRLRKVRRDIAQVRTIIREHDSKQDNLLGGE
jgi:large subunit ribosomal protein L29